MTLFFGLHLILAPIEMVKTSCLGIRAGPFSGFLDKDEFCSKDKEENETEKVLEVAYKIEVVFYGPRKEIIRGLKELESRDWTRMNPN